MFLWYLKGGLSDFFLCIYSYSQDYFCLQAFFSWVSDSSVVMTGTGDAFLHVAVKLDTHTKEYVWNEP